MNEFNTQSESQLEENLINWLQGNKYKKVSIKNNTDLLSNFKSQLEKFNKDTFTDKEFKNIINHLDKGDIFEKAKTLRDKFAIIRDDKRTKYISFLDTDNFDDNIFQVTHQININGKRSNRYDVSILINGLPLVHIEIKKKRH